MIHIYALVDPETHQVRYIGKSIRPRERLVNQMNERANTYRSNWLQGLRRRGLAPEQVILLSLPPESDWQNAERFWIAEGRRRGWPLVNGTKGGDGVSGLTGESKERMARTWVGRKHRPETLVKIGAASVSGGDFGKGDVVGEAADTVFVALALVGRWFPEHDLLAEVETRLARNMDPNGGHRSCLPAASRTAASGVCLPGTLPEQSETPSQR